MTLLERAMMLLDFVADCRTIVTDTDNPLNTGKYIRTVCSPIYRSPYLDSSCGTIDSTIMKQIKNQTEVNSYKGKVDSAEGTPQMSSGVTWVAQLQDVHGCVERVESICVVQELNLRECEKDRRCAISER